MSRADDRIPVSGNGHHPPLEAHATASEPDARAPGPAQMPASVPSGDAPSAPAPPDDGVALRPSLAVNATPAQLAVGLGIVASLVLLAIGARRRRR